MIASSVTLTKDDYEVLRRVPAEWWPEEEVLTEISIATLRAKRVIRGRFTEFRRLSLIERRVRQTIEPVAEVRRIAKD